MNSLVDKWEKTGLLFGIEDELRRRFVANNLEFAARWLVIIANDGSRKIDDIEQLSGVVIPVVARVSITETFDLPINIALDKLLEISEDINLPMEYLEDDQKKWNFESYLTSIYSELLKRIIEIEEPKWGL